MTHFLQSLPPTSQKILSSHETYRKIPVRQHFISVLKYACHFLLRCFLSSYTSSTPFPNIENIKGITHCNHSSWSVDTAPKSHYPEYACCENLFDTTESREAQGLATLDQNPLFRIYIHLFHDLSRDLFQCCGPCCWWQSSWLRCHGTLWK